MSKFVKIKKDFHADQNFWDLNPQVKYIPPFADLYQRDTSSEHIESSKQMWCVVFICDPDEEENIFARFDPEKIRTVLSETYFPSIDWDDELLIRCIEEYPEVCLSAEERSFAEARNAFRKLTRFLNTTPLTTDNVTAITNAHAKVPKIRQDYEKIEEEFRKKKSNETLKAGRRLSKQEKRDI